MSEALACCHQKKQGLFRNKLFLVTVFILALVLLSYIFPPLVAFRKVLFHYVKLIWWAVFLGLFLGGLIDYYIPREYVSKILAKKSPLTIVNAVFLGFLMSACSHGILALSIQLHKKGASNPAVVSFLLASPWANLAVTMMLLSLFGLKGLWIVLSAIIIALNTGFIFMFLESRGLIERNTNIVEVPEGYSILEDLGARAKSYKFDLASLSRDLTGVIKGLISLSQMVLWWILLGILIASLTGAFIPTHFFHKFMGPTFWGLIITLILATIIEVC
ncbi:MAG: permease, partial [Nitrospirota bacterium]